MDRTLERILTECLRELENDRSTVEDCLRRYRDRAPELEGPLRLWRNLDGSARANPSSEGQALGRQRMLAKLVELESPEGSWKRFLRAPFATAIANAAAIVAVAIVLGGGAMGVSAAMGGPNVPERVLTTIGVRDDGGRPAAAREELAGMCRAYLSGAQAPEEGDPVAFQRLSQAAADANQTIESFCNGLLAASPGRTGNVDKTATQGPKKNDAQDAGRGKNADSGAKEADREGANRADKDKEGDRGGNNRGRQDTDIDKADAGKPDNPDSGDRNASGGDRRDADISATPTPKPRTATPTPRSGDRSLHDEDDKRDDDKR